MTTSPSSPAAIEAVFGDGDLRDVTLRPAQTMRGEWRRFSTFLRRPELPGETAPTGAAARGMGRMIALDLIIMGALIAILMTLVAFGVELPDNLNARLDLTPGTIALIVIAAPVLEELVFRSWLSGKPGYLLAFAILLASAGVAAIQGVSKTGQEAQLGVGLSILGGLVLALIALIALRKRPAMRWFAALFPMFFWLSAGGFALFHLLNYTEGALWALLPLLLPQFILGTIAAYNRVNYGLWTAMVTHAAHNGFAISLALLAIAAGTES